MRRTDHWIDRLNRAVPTPGDFACGTRSSEARRKVIAGTVNVQGSLHVEVKGTAEETALAGIMRLVEPEVRDAHGRFASRGESQRGRGGRRQRGTSPGRGHRGRHPSRILRCRRAV